MELMPHTGVNPIISVYNLGIFHMTSKYLIGTGE